MDFNEIIGRILNSASSTAGATDNTGSGQQRLPAGTAGSGQEWLSGGSRASGQQQRFGPEAGQQWQPTGSAAGQQQLPAMSGLGQQWMPDGSGQGQQRSSTGSGSVQPWSAEGLRADQQRLSYGSAGSVQQQRPQLLREPGSGSGQQRMYGASANLNLQNTIQQPQLPSGSINSTLQQALSSVTEERGMSLSESERQSVVQSVLARLAASQQTNPAPSLNPINPAFNNSAISSTSVDSLLNLIAPSSRNQAPVTQQRDTSIDSALSRINTILNPGATAVDFAKLPSFSEARQATTATSGYSGRDDRGLDFSGITWSKLDERREDLPPPSSYPTRIINDVDPDDLLEFLLTKTRSRESRHSPDRREQRRRASRSPDRGSRLRRSGSRSRRRSRSRSPPPKRYSGRNPNDIQIVRVDYDRPLDMSLRPTNSFDDSRDNAYMQTLPCAVRRVIRNAFQQAKNEIGRPIEGPKGTFKVRDPMKQASILRSAFKEVEAVGNGDGAQKLTEREVERVCGIISQRVIRYNSTPKNNHKSRG